MLLKLELRTLVAQLNPQIGKKKKKKRQILLVESSFNLFVYIFLINM